MRHNVANLRDIVPSPEWEAKPKIFKAYHPGFIHIDFKYLPAMADGDEQMSVFSAIDRGRWVVLERHRMQWQQAATRFLKHLQ